MAYDIDPDQSVSIVAIFLFIDAAFLGFPLLSSMINGSGLPILLVLVVAGLIEGFVSPAGFPWPGKLAIGLASAVAFYGYFLLAGRPVKGRNPPGWRNETADERR